MIDLITFLDNNRKYAVYTVGNIHGIYSYIEIIKAPTKLTTSGKSSNHLCPSYSINNYTASIQTDIEDLQMR